MSRLVVSPSPHISEGEDISTVMFDVILALVPAMLVSVYVFGLNALFVIAVTAGSAMLFEYVTRRLLKRQTTIRDYSALLTGIILALNLPPSIPWWTAVAGSFVAIVIAKELAGGLGHNIFNPAAVGRAFLHVSWGVAMGAYLVPLWWQKTGSGFFDFAYLKFNEGVASVATLGSGAVDSITGATPLQLIKPSLDLPGEASISALFFGNVGGSLGETSAFALLIGGLYLIWRKRIDWRVPAVFIGTVALLSLILGGNPLYHVLAGGVMLGAFFMLTDYVTAPITPIGRMIFAAGAGVLTVLMRFYGGFPEGVVYAILFMNALVPLIDRYIKNTAFGRVE